MKTLLATGLIFTACLVNGSPRTFSPSTKTTIVGGQEATPHQFPWQISLKYRDLAFGLYYHTCGATIVDEWHIVCAAHCIDGRKASHFKVVAGAHNIHSVLPESTTQTVHVENMWKHESYDNRVITNDVSLLKLDQPLVFDEYVQPMRLATNETAPGTVCVNSGWGSTSHTSVAQMPNKLQYVEMPIVERAECQADYSGINGVDEGMVCAGVTEGGVSACSGDSGGPLVCPDESGEYYLAGIVSWGVIPCGQPDKPGVYTNVIHFKDWIEEKMAI